MITKEDLDILKNEIKDPDLDLEDVYWLNKIEELIAEVERLRFIKDGLEVDNAEFDGANKEYGKEIKSLKSQLAQVKGAITDRDELIESVKNSYEGTLKKQLAAVEKERDEWKERFSRVMLSEYEQKLKDENSELKVKLIMFADSNAFINEENAKLQERVEELENG